MKYGGTNEPENTKEINGQISWICGNIYGREEEGIYTVISHDMSGTEKLIDDGVLGNTFVIKEKYKINSGLIRYRKPKPGHHPVPDQLEKTASAG